MLTATVKQELEITIETALMLAEPGTPIQLLAERIYSSEVDLMEKLRRAWMVERLMWMLRCRRLKIRPANQLTLPGFEKLPGRLTMGKGRWVLLRRANLKQLEQYRAALLKRQERRAAELSKREDPRIDQLDGLITLVRRHSRVGVLVTVQDVMTEEMAKLEKKSAPR